MHKNCLTCSTRIKADAKWNENQGDFWHCTAVVPVQGFGVMWLENRALNPRTHVHAQVVSNAG